MNFRQLISKYITGNISTDQLPSLGEVALKEGLDSPSLCILAGLSRNESSFEGEHYFMLTLKELGISLPNKRQAAIDYSLAIVDEILEGKKEIIKGITEIRFQAIDSYDFFSENKNYCYDSIGFETIYGLFVQYEDYDEMMLPWQSEKTKEQLKSETKVELFEQLKKWKDKMNHQKP